MARVLYTSWFSPFARKVALGLELKGLQYEAVDGLKRDFHSELARLNGRVEVPVLVDDGLVVVNSADIVQYLEWRYPTPPLYPEPVEDRVAARALERLADHRLDPIVVDCSYWSWADRDDQPPEGLLAAGQADFDSVLAQLEAELAKRPKPWPFGTPGLVECSWYPNLVAAQPLGFKIDKERFANISSWLSAIRRHPVFFADARRTAMFLKTLSSATHETRKLFWSGDRLEWLLSRGYHEWFANEIREGRVAYPPSGARASG